MTRIRPGFGINVYESDLFLRHLSMIRHEDSRQPLFSSISNSQKQEEDAELRELVSWFYDLGLKFKWVGGKPTQNWAVVRFWPSSSWVQPPVAWSTLYSLQASDALPLLLF